MAKVKITLKDVQKALLSMFSDKTILIGHSLESDLHSLKVSFFLLFFSKHMKLYFLM